MRKNVTANDPLIAGIKKRLLDVITEFMRARPNQVATYLPAIKETCARTFTGDPTALVKEAALKLLEEIIDHYPMSVLAKIIDSTDLVSRLLDTIKHQRPSASVKGTIWTLVGLCHKKFGDDVQDLLVESQD